MALHSNFPKSPYEVLLPEFRWFPADEVLREKGYEKLLPPLVAELRRKVKEFRDSNYNGASKTSKALLYWWFQAEHLLSTASGPMRYFQYYFAQREAIETIIYLHEIVKVKDKYDLLRFDCSGIVSAGMFAETWSRYVIKMATGSGKTKVMSLVLAWSYFHKIYEEDSTLSRNFLVIAPNIIVLDRLRADFGGLKIFYNDPLLPDNGFEGKNWRDDFQLTLHIQDELGLVRKTGNIFLTNIHRVYEGDTHLPSFEDEDTTDYFLGKRLTGKTTDSRVDLDVIIRDVEELLVINDEAHHVHDERLTWFKCIEDINNRLKMKARQLSLQVDVTATPKHNNGAIFVQTVSDYPLVEAIAQNVVKRPVLPDSASRAKLQERQSSKFTEKYQDYLHLGYLEWRKTFDEHQKLGKKAVLFIMTDDTKNCDEVASYLENTYQEFKNAILVIHTKNNGEISEVSSGKNAEELKRLREAANSIDDDASPYKVIVSVLMLKEGWDVQNVTTIVGLRAYSSKANILPEQTLGRGLRRMYRGCDDVTEYVSVVGTDAFMDFIESIKSEGVELDRVRMGEGSNPKTPIVVEVDHENVKKDIEKLDIKIPVLTPRIYREYKNLSELCPNAFANGRVKLIYYSKDEQEKDIVFKDITTNEITHITKFDSTLSPDFRSVVGFFAQTIMRELRLVSGYDVLYGKVKEFIQNNLFEQQIEFEDLNVLRNLSELEARKTIIETFKKEINALTVRDKGEAEVRDYIKISKCRPFIVKEQGYLVPKKSAFNKIIGDSHFELEFASFLEECSDIVSYVKNYFAVNFKIDYQDASGFISNYYPDFIVKVSDRETFIVETKGREDLDDLKKFKRLKQWCEDINKLQNDTCYTALYVSQEEYEKYKAKSFLELVKVVSLFMSF